MHIYIYTYVYIYNDICGFGWNIFEDLLPDRPRPKSDAVEGSRNSRESGDARGDEGPWGQQSWRFHESRGTHRKIQQIMATWPISKTPGLEIIDECS